MFDESEDEDHDYEKIIQQMHVVAKDKDQVKKMCLL